MGEITTPDYKHVHKFTKAIIAHVILHKETTGIRTAKDTLKQWQCECGAVETYDLERVLL